MNKTHILGVSLIVVGVILTVIGWRYLPIGFCDSQDEGEVDIYVKNLWVKEGVCASHNLTLAVGEYPPFGSASCTRAVCMGKTHELFMFSHSNICEMELRQGVGINGN